MGHRRCCGSWHSDSLALTLWQLVDAVAGHREQQGTRSGCSSRAPRSSRPASTRSSPMAPGRSAPRAAPARTGPSRSSPRSWACPPASCSSARIGLAVAIWAGALIRQRNHQQVHVSISRPRRTRSDLSDTYVRIGTVGYVGKGVALLAVAGLILWAAETSDPDKSGGLDEAMRKILDAAVRLLPAADDRSRPRLLRAVLLCPGPPPRPLGAAPGDRRQQRVRGPSLPSRGQRRWSHDRR